MTTEIPNVANVPAPPSLARPESFDAESDAFLSDFQRLFTEQNLSIDAMNLLGAEMEALATATNGSAEIALGVANYKGGWSSLSGAINMPASVSHGGEFYILTSNLPDVTTDEPGVSAVWISPWKDHYTKTQIDTMLTGQVAFFATENPPTGWLKANGAELSRTTYAGLFAVIGTTFGAGDGSTTFNLPDLRGEFLRAWDDSRGIDTGRSMGSAQSDENKSHVHTGTADSGGVHSHTGSTGSAGSHNHSMRSSFTQTGSGYSMEVLNQGSLGTYISSGGSHNHSVTINPGGGHAHSLTINGSGGSETRPRNIALLACIKY